MAMNSGEMILQRNAQSMIGGGPGSVQSTMFIRNGRLLQAFDPSTNQNRDVYGIVPQNYAGENVTVRLHVAMASAITGDIDFDFAFERIGTGQDLDADGFATAKSSDNNTVPGTAGLILQIALTFTQAEADGITAGDAFRVRITRDAVSDTATGDAHVFGVDIRVA